MTRPFILNEQIKESLLSLKKYAEEHPFTIEDLENIINNKFLVPGDRNEFRRYIPFGYKVVLTTEKQEPGLIRHLSMSVDTRGKLPNKYVVQEVMKILGFKSKLSECMISLEEAGCVNVLELIEE